MNDPANLSLCYYNESLDLFIPVESYYDEVNHTISANVTHFSLWGIFIFNTNILQQVYTAANNFNKAIKSTVEKVATIPKRIVEEVDKKVYAIKTYAVDTYNNVVKIVEQVKTAIFGSTKKDTQPTPIPTQNPTVTINPTSNPTYTPTPTATPSPVADPVRVTYNKNAEVNYFGSGASFSAGVYKIHASGWYTHWYPLPTVLKCIDQGHDEEVIMPAWNSRGMNYPYWNVSDQDRYGMHVAYGDQDSPVCRLRVAEGILEFSHFGGTIAIWDHDDNYGDNTADARYVLEYVGEPLVDPNPSDSDGDGLPDDVEIHGFADAFNRHYFTDPYEPDTDGDGLWDGEEAGTWTELNGMKYFNVRSNPMKADSDGDGLDDYEEVRHTSVVYAADTHDKALNFLKAVHDGMDYSPYLTRITATSHPLREDSDGDTIPDCDEIMMGTNPGARDTDSDSIPDNLEKVYGEDPTVFDISPPVVNVYYSYVYKPPFSFDTEYDFRYIVTDYGGVKGIAVIKNDIQRDSYSYPAGRTSVSECTYFITNWETALDALRTVSIDIDANDYNGNTETTLAYQRSSMYGQMASMIGSDTILIVRSPVAWECSPAWLLLWWRYLSL